MGLSSYYIHRTYKAHFVCFDCKKQFKKTNIYDYLKGKELKIYNTLSYNRFSKKLKKKEKELGATLKEIEENYLKNISKCPECKKEMTEVPMRFQPPPKQKKREWENIYNYYLYCNYHKKSKGEILLDQISKKGNKKKKSK